MAAKRIVEVGSLAITVRELFFEEVRDWLVVAESGATDDAILALAFDECSLSDIAYMSDVKAVQLEKFAPSELGELVNVCKELNPHFFRVRTALSGAVRFVENQLDLQTSTKLPVPSSHMAMPESGPTPGEPS